MSVHMRGRCTRGSTERWGGRFWCAPDAHKEVSAEQKLACLATPDGDGAFKDTDCSALVRKNEREGERRGGPGEGGGWWGALTCGAASTSGNHVRE